MRLQKAASFHKVARFLDLSRGWCGKQKKNCQQHAHGLASFILAWALALLPFPALPSDLPAPLRAEDFISFDPKQAALGRLLFFDKILSGNRNISCGTCHHHEFGGSDGLPLGLGEGGQGIGTARTAGEGSDRIRKRIPRNAPGLWNLGHKSIRILFHDGRLSTSGIYGNEFNSPAEEWLPEGLNSILAAQAVFPLAAQFEMAGNPEENEIAGALHDRIDAVWPIVAKRVRTVPEYGELFLDAFDEIETPEDVTIVEIANALAAFMGVEWRSTDSPFDSFLRGDALALSADQKRGLDLFYGRARCVNCHSGPLLTDQGFHALGLPAFGPGRTRRFDPVPRDVGRMGKSDRLEDAYRFRTPSLRNVALTAPYGHNGAYPTLNGIVRHHLDPKAARNNWDREKIALPEAPWLASTDFVIQLDRFEMERQAAALDIEPISLSETEIADLVAFLHALTDTNAHQKQHGPPVEVPSGLPVDVSAK
jgi:cytochrome c peroxidase